MIRCPECGNVFPDDSKYCGRCGTDLTRQGIYAQEIKEKETFLAIIFSLVLAGMGQIYCGKVWRGLAILVCASIPALLANVIVGFNADNLADRIDDSLGILVLILAAAIIIDVWQVFDAYKLSIKWNEELARTYSKPW